MAAIIRIKWTCDGEEEEVVKLSYKFNQSIDAIGQPAGEVRGGIIDISLRTLASSMRYGWMISSDMKKSGSLDFEDKDGKVLKKLEFEDAYCVTYHETFDDTDISEVNGRKVQTGVLEHLTLSAKKITIDGNSHENTWES